ncbi:hypothetical protein [Thomasclavelia sp.]|uniref:hypothetical protein n=1 Tax=Thomasclavelia sp. TaxID=3025757 RepID=UPI0025EE92D8|nr:hypothetical protein [Thomasclavelia sp.]
MEKYRKLIVILGTICLLIALIVFLNKTPDFDELYHSNDYYMEQSDYQKIITFEIDLTNPETAINKKIKIDNECCLEIISLRLLENGQYDIVFNSIGNIENGEGIIYTANYYVIDNKENYIETKTSFISNDNENWYPSSWNGFDGNGDSFGYSIEKDNVKNKKHCLIKISNLNRIEFKK